MLLTTKTLKKKPLKKTKKKTGKTDLKGTEIKFQFFFVHKVQSLFWDILHVRL